MGGRSEPEGASDKVGSTRRAATQWRTRRSRVAAHRDAPRGERRPPVDPSRRQRHRAQRDARTPDIVRPASAIVTAQPTRRHRRLGEAQRNRARPRRRRRDANRASNCRYGLLVGKTSLGGPTQTDPAPMPYAYYPKIRAISERRMAEPLGSHTKKRTVTNHIAATSWHVFYLAIKIRSSQTQTANPA